MKKRPATQNLLFDNFLKMILPKVPAVIGVSEAFENRAKYVFLDAREDAEFMVSHIRDAIHIGFNNFKPCCLSDLDRSANYIVYCSLGWRSGKVCQLLKQHGFANNHNLYGGIFEWVNLGKEVVSNSIPVRRIHAYSKSWGLWVSCPGKVY